MHHFYEMLTEFKKKKKNLFAKLKAKRVNKTVLYEFAVLADQLEFKSDKIFTLKQQSSDRKIVHNVLLKV